MIEASPYSVILCQIVTLQIAFRLVTQEPSVDKIAALEISSQAIQVRVKKNLFYGEKMWGILHFRNKGASVLVIKSRADVLNALRVKFLKHFTLTFNTISNTIGGALSRNEVQKSAV